MKIGYSLIKIEISLQKVGFSDKRIKYPVEKTEIYVQTKNIQIKK